MRNWLDSNAAGLAFFEKAKHASKAAQTDEFRSFAAWFKQDVPGKIKEGVQAAIGKWDGDLSKGLRAAEQNFDSGTTDEFRKRMFQEIDAGYRAVKLLIPLSEGWEGAPRKQWVEDLAKIEAGRVKLKEQFDAVMKARRLPPAASTNARLLAIGKDCVSNIVREENRKGLRVTAEPWQHEYREVSGEWIIVTWWESFRVDFAARRAGDQVWHWESFTISRRLDSGSNPIGSWSLNGSELRLSCELLPENVED